MFVPTRGAGGGRQADRRRAGGARGRVRDRHGRGRGAGGQGAGRGRHEGGDAGGGRALHGRRVHRAPARDDRAALPRRRPDRRRWATCRSCCRSGRRVGGTTLVNSGTCFRTPEPVLELWRERFGLEALTPAGAGPLLPPGRARAERGAGAARAGRQQRAGGQARRGRPRLVGRLHLPQRARAAWARACAPSAAPRARSSTRASPTCRRPGRRAPPPARACGRGGSWWRAGAPGGWRPSTAGGGTLRVECDTVVVACGAIHTPLLPAPQRPGRRARASSGRNLAIHPATAVRALFDEEIDMARGVPQSFYIDEFADEGIMFEGAAGPPDYLAIDLAVLARAPPRADAALPQPRAVRRDGVRPLARPRARARRAHARSATTSATRTSRRSGAGSSCSPSSTGRPARSGCSCRWTGRRAHATAPQRPLDGSDAAALRADADGLPPARHRAGRRRPRPRRGRRRPEAARRRGASTCPTRAPCRARWA